TAEIFTLSLHDALPIYRVDTSGHRPAQKVQQLGSLLVSGKRRGGRPVDIRDRRDPESSHLALEPGRDGVRGCRHRGSGDAGPGRSEEHTSELQSRFDLV